MKMKLNVVVTIEIEFNGVKGSICDDDWDDLDVKVV